MKNLFYASLVVVAGLGYYSYRLNSSLQARMAELTICSKSLTIADSTIHALTMTVAATPGYVPPATKTSSVAGSYANWFRSNNAPNFNGMEGGVISKSTFDEIFLNTEVNAIAYSFAIDNSQVTIPGKPNGLFIVLSGAKMLYNASRWNMTTIGTQKYIPNNWCPTFCLSY